MEFISSLAHRIPRLYRNLLPIPCFLCGGPSYQYALCSHCIAEMPLIKTACSKCARPLPHGHICGQCLQKPPPYTAAFSLFVYQEPVDRCIAAFKYHNQLSFIDYFADMSAAKLACRESLPECMVPIPLHSHRLRQRGYNQSYEFSKKLAQHLNMNVRTDILNRVRNTPPQASLTLKQRRQNMKNAFACTRTTLPETIALIDDVYTTGITLAEATKTLQRHGAKHIEVWTIARAIRHY